MGTRKAAWHELVRYVASFTKRPSPELNPEESAVVPSIQTSDIAEKLKLIEKLGGRTLKDKTSIGRDAKYGLYALFKDPNRNKMYLYPNE